MFDMSKLKKNKNHRKRLETDFAKNLQKVLRERGLTLRAAAEIAGVNQSVISSWTAGSQPADLLAVQKLSQGLGVDFEWLLTGNSSQITPQALALTQIFEEEDAFSGIFRLEAKRLIRKEEN